MTIIRNSPEARQYLRRTSSGNTFRITQSDPMLRRLTAAQKQLDTLKRSNA